MRILCNDEGLLESGLMETLSRAACLCLEKEAIDPARAEISLSIVSKEEIRRLNQLYRKIDNHTDVLSFPLIEDFNQIDDREEFLLGDVVICLQQAEEQAEEYGHSREREIVYLFVHSVCHLLGYDHMDEGDKREMRAREEEIMSLLDLGRNR
ncbi:MAG: rRNA maturation RNase YbeY [Bacillota bacterium]|nr:rRNA maturation RNase YbeY [Bacillota bacterium]